ncbi:MAG: hypothetical protein DMF54_17075 [Acidobacteria bacterium]|nr:MAG: hypothetical protein DMF54_17075 [Acidobacteriota bacterium]
MDPPATVRSPIVDARTGQPRLLDRVRLAIRARHYSLRTEEAYIAWIRRFVLFHGRRHPAEMGQKEINAFLTDLAVEGRVSASTQNQALAALLFLYRHVLDQPLPAPESILRAKRPRRLPVVLTRAEVRAVIGRMRGTPRIVAVLLYGSGMRLLWSATPRASATASCLFRWSCAWNSRPVSLGQSACTSEIWPEDLDPCFCPKRFPENIRAPTASGAGSGSSPPSTGAAIPGRKWSGVIICTRP